MLKRQDGRTVTSGDTKSIATGRKQGVDELKEPSSSRRRSRSRSRRRRKRRRRRRRRRRR